MEFFIKFGKKEHIEKLFHCGMIFMKPLDYFRICDNNEIRDPLEGVKQIVHFNKVEFYKPNENGNGPGEKIIVFDGSYTAYPTEKYEGNLFCVYMVTKEDLEIHERMGLSFVNIYANFKEYDYFCVINAVEFIKKIKNAFKDLDISFENGRVKYLDYKNDIKSLNPFNKDIKHQHQKEYRFYIPSENKDKDRCFIIGSIEDIAQIHPIDNVDKIRFARKML